MLFAAVGRLMVKLLVVVEILKIFPAVPVETVVITLLPKEMVVEVPIMESLPSPEENTNPLPKDRLPKVVVPVPPLATDSWPAQAKVKACAEIEPWILVSLTMLWTTLLLSLPAASVPVKVGVKVWTEPEELITKPMLASLPVAKVWEEVVKPFREISALPPTIVEVETKVGTPLPLDCKICPVVPTKVERRVEPS